MADKAEIIEITFYNKRGWGERLPQMTRAEAVERMAKAICRQTNGGKCTGCECFEEKNEKRCKEIYMDSEYREPAEAALDALLGGKND